MKKKMKDRESSDWLVKNKRESEKNVLNTNVLSNSDSKRRLRTRRLREGLLFKVSRMRP